MRLVRTVPGYLMKTSEAKYEFSETGRCKLRNKPEDGVLQIVMRDTSLLKGINKEDCISVLGKIEKRDEETYNPKIPTGTIELEAHSIEILGKVYRPLPFEIATSKEIREDLRLKYRFLDLRNPKVMSNMIFRSNVIAFLRQKMTELGFMEVQTPILCASSPEGARDYISSF